MFTDGCALAFRDAEAEPDGHERVVRVAPRLERGVNIAVSNRPVQHVAGDALAMLDDRINGPSRRKDDWKTAMTWLSTDDNFSRVLPPLAAASLHKDAWTPSEIAASLGIDVDTFRRAYAEVKRGR